MRAAIAVLSDHHVQNVARKLVYEINERQGIQFLGSLLPAHVSLKQPFTFESMDVLEDWLESFSKQITPFTVQLQRAYYAEWDGYAIIGLEVLETPTLRGLHEQINRELNDVVRDSSAPHDGDEYRFHLTIELGKVGSSNPFKQMYEALPEKNVDLSFTARSLALFLYADGASGPGSFICYKVLPLTGQPDISPSPRVSSHHTSCVKTSILYGPMEMLAQASNPSLGPSKASTSLLKNP
jgi:2'-5' RNA ligase